MADEGGCLAGTSLVSVILLAEHLIDVGWPLILPQLASFSLDGFKIDSHLVPCSCEFTAAGFWLLLEHT